MTSSLYLRKWREWTVLEGQRELVNLSSKISQITPLLTPLLTEVTNPGRVELPILLRVLQEDDKPLPIGSFTERSIIRKVQHLTGVTLDQVTMVTLTDAVLELPVGAPVLPVAQEFHLMHEWEDMPIYVSYLMGNRCYIMEVCHDRAKYEEKKREMELEAERLWEEQLEQQDPLTTLVDHVYEKA